MQTTCFKFMAEANVSVVGVVFTCRTVLCRSSFFSERNWLSTVCCRMKEYEKAMDAYRETIHKPLPKGDIKYPEQRLQNATDLVSEQYRKLKEANCEAKEKVCHVP